MRMRKALAIALAIALAGCSETTDYDDTEFAGESYDEYDERRDSYDGEYGSFEGYDCTVDCSGHEAGYNWAADNGITDPEDCGGRSWSFIEGCRAYAGEYGEY